MVTNGRQSDRRGGSRRRDDQEDSAFVEQVVKIRRVSKVVKGGRNLTFNAMVVVGDGAGNVGIALGKAGAVPDAVRKGTANARKSMVPVILRDTTIPHEVTYRFSGSSVLLKPAAPGTGVIAGGGVRAVLEAAGVKDVLTKTFGSTNSINVVKATLEALKLLRDPQTEIARRRAATVHA
jgi:small subunit ribosomal protein S5